MSDYSKDLYFSKPFPLHVLSNLHARMCTKIYAHQIINGLNLYTSLRDTCLLSTTETTDNWRRLGRLTLAAAANQEWCTALPPSLL